MENYMDTTNTDAISASDSQQTFFLQSPFRSAEFIVLTIFSCVFVIADGIVVVKFWRSLQAGLILWLILLAYYGAFGGVLRILRAHEKIHEQYLVGKIENVPLGSPLALALDTAGRTLKQALAVDLVMMVPYLFLIYYFAGHHR